MPMKFPKGFQRRRSSGNVLDEISSPPQTSFRVLERQPDGSKSFDGLPSAPPKAQSRPLSEGKEKVLGIRPPLNRGGTQNSASSGVYDNSSSSARYSSSSTLPSSSSIDAANTNDEYSHGHPKRPQKATAQSSSGASAGGFSLRAAGRTFSFGARKAAQQQMQASTPEEAPLPQIPQQHVEYADIPDVMPTGLRQRAMTESSHASGSTATPPKILDMDLDFGSSGGDDGFSNMFSTLNGDKRLSRKFPDAGFSGFMAEPSKSATGSDPPKIAALHLDRMQTVSPALFSPDSQSSGDRLIAASPMSDEGGFRRSSPSPAGAHNMPSRSAPGVPGSYREPTQDSFRPQHLQQPPAVPKHGSPSPEPIDEELKLAMRYMNGGTAPRVPQKQKTLPVLPRKPLSSSVDPQARPQQLSHSYSDRTPVTLYDGGNQDDQSSATERNDSITTTPRAKLATLAQQPNDSLVDDLHFREMARSADLFQAGGGAAALKSRQTAPVGKSKVMTPAQFEQYKRDQESWRNSQDGKSDSEDEDDVNDEEDDEEERNREMARQRRRQEAQLAVYRQTMMKVTGEPQPLAATAARPASQSAGNLLLSPPQIRGRDSKESSDGDEDEDIPLGILAAHGFPSKERPPSHLDRMSSQPNIRYQSETYPPPPASVAGGASNAPGGSRASTLPPFARNLPRDPYYGASIVNPSNRESLAMHSGGTASVYGGSQAAAIPAAAHPGGLVGIIAKEERAKAMRRGSPNAAMHDSANAMPLPPGMGGPAAPPAFVTPEQQANAAQMAQMTQMMQMQMQWMQQMMQMQGQQMPQGMMPPPGMMMPGMTQSMPSAGMMNMQQQQPPQIPRPASQGSLSANRTGLGARPPSQLAASGRAMSMLAPPVSSGQNWNNNHRASVAINNGNNSGRMSVLSQNMGGALTNNNKPLASPGPGYAPSLAPTERSTVGMPSRYRPVSIAPADEIADSNRKRASTITATSSTLGNNKSAAAVSVRAVPAAKAGGGDEEDEDAAWAEMKRKKESKKSLWRGKRATGRESALEGMFVPGIE